VDLVGQLPGRDHYQAARLPGRPLAARGRGPDQQRQPEGQGLARAGLGPAEDVTAGQGVGQGAGLDGAGGGDVAGGQRRDQGRGDAEFGEGASRCGGGRSWGGRGCGQVGTTLRSEWVGRPRCQTALGRPTPADRRGVRTKYVACDDREDRPPSLDKVWPRIADQQTSPSVAPSRLPSLVNLGPLLGGSPGGSPRRCLPWDRGRPGGRHRPRDAAHHVEAAQSRGLLELLSQVVEQAGGRHPRLGRQPFDQAVHHHMGEPFHLRIDNWDRLVGQHPGCTPETGHARINSSRHLLERWRIVCGGPGTERRRLQDNPASSIHRASDD
jgi:hypothetical protein